MLELYLSLHPYFLKSVITGIIALWVLSYFLLYKQELIFWKIAVPFFGGICVIFELWRTL